MSSKEKRQLRNKISARNFRVRRKEYITTLEIDIAERDRLIDAICGNLGSTKSENTALRQEIDALKNALLHDPSAPLLPPPAPLPAVSAAASVAARSNTTPSSPLAIRSYASLSVAYIQMLKAFTPVTVLVISWTFRIQVPSKKLTPIVLMISVDVTPSLSWRAPMT